LRAKHFWVETDGECASDSEEISLLETVQNGGELKRLFGGIFHVFDDFMYGF
jgi:hypothetical protein